MEKSAVCCLKAEAYNFKSVKLFSVPRFVFYCAIAEPKKKTNLQDKDLVSYLQRYEYYIFNGVKFYINFPMVGY